MNTGDTRTADLAARLRAALLERALIAQDPTAEDRTAEVDLERVRARVRVGIEAALAESSSGGEDNSRESSIAP